jgi:hypothetical protein
MIFIVGQRPGDTQPKKDPLEESGQQKKTPEGK